MEKTHRLEWISLLYLAFFVLAVISPSLYTQGSFGLSEEMLEQITIFLFGLAGILTFTFYERLMENREKEAKVIEGDVERIKAELLDSYTYIGSVNRKMELIKRLANEASAHFLDKKQLPKELLQGVVQGALAATGAESGLLRMLDRASLRTVQEIQVDSREKQVFHIANRELRALDEQKLSHAFLATDEGLDVLAVPSDAYTPDTKAYLLLILPRQYISEVDVPLLKVLVNQAQMIDRVAKMQQ